MWRSHATRPSKRRIGAQGSSAGREDGNEGSSGAACDLEGSSAGGSPASARRVLLVSILGSMDDVAVFISILLGETFTWPQLLLTRRAHRIHAGRIVLPLCHALRTRDTPDPTRATFRRRRQLRCLHAG